MSKLPALITALLSGLLPGSASAHGSAALVLLMDHSAVMPTARIDDKGRVTDGINRDLAQLLGERLGRVPHFLALPRRRIPQALAQGQADLVCGYLPAWLPGPFAWSRPFLPSAYWVVTRQDRPAPESLQALAQQRLGTVRGFAYPELEAALGRPLLRDDAPNGVTSLRMLALARVDHVVVVQRFLEYQQRIGAFTTPLHPPLEVSRYLARCALSPRSRIGLDALNEALGAIVEDGSLERLLQRYR